MKSLKSHRNKATTVPLGTPRVNNVVLGSGGTVHGWKNTVTWPLGRLVMEADQISVHWSVHWMSDLSARTDHWEWVVTCIICNRKC